MALIQLSTKLELKLKANAELLWTGNDSFELCLEINKPTRPGSLQKAATLMTKHLRRNTTQFGECQLMFAPPDILKSMCVCVCVCVRKKRRKRVDVWFHNLFTSCRSKDLRVTLLLQIKLHHRRLQFESQTYLGSIQGNGLLLVRVRNPSQATSTLLPVTGTDDHRFRTKMMGRFNCLTFEIWQRFRWMFMRSSTYISNSSQSTIRELQALPFIVFGAA